VSTLETLRAAPSGSSEVSAMLMGAADSLVRGGDTGIFTPSYFFLARKPS
jgi:sterol 24-C-methyltransferase